MPLSPARAAALLADNVQRVIQGKPEVVRLATVALFAEGHLLLEDVPGTGKTSLARSLARSIGGRWSRIQFTPDLLPGDITGVMVFHQGTGSFEFRPGGVFANVVLADEINRGTPKTQSALLEVMAERQRHGRLGAARGAAAVPRRRHAEPDRARRHLPAAGGPARPVPHAGRRRLPRPRRRGPGVLGAATGVDPDALTPVLDLPELARGHHAGAAAARRPAGRRLRGRAGRGAPGSTPPSATAPARAAASRWSAPRARWPPRSRTGRSSPPDDIKTVAHAVLAHRIVLTPEAELNRRTAAEVLDDVLGAIPQPLPAGRGAGLTVRPTPRGAAVLVGAVALLVLGVVLNLPAAARARRVALGAVALAFVPTAGRLRLGVTRAVHPDRVDTGARARSPSWWSATGPTAAARLHRRWTTVGSQVRPVRVRSLPPGGSARYRYELPTTRRGRIPSGR